jgi:hypothetical protein
MTLYELRFFGVLGLIVIGIIAVLVMLAITAVRGFARRLDARIARARALPSLRGDGHDVARLIDRRQAAWRLKC